MKKKRFSILMIIVISLVFVLFGCNKDIKEEQEVNNNQTQESEDIDQTGDDEAAAVNNDTTNESEPIFPKTQLKPVDDGLKDESFSSFRQEFIKKLKNKDLEYLLSHLNSNIKVSFGDTMGIEGFKEYWKLNNSPEDSEVWIELIRVLELGGVFSSDSQDSFIAPYVYYLFPESYDAFSYSAIVGSNVNVREKPSSKSNIVTNISYEIVKHEYLPPEQKTKEAIQGDNYYWEKITTSEGKEGYVYGKYIRSPIDYRAFFSKNESGDWIMDIFLAGD